MNIYKRIVTTITKTKLTLWSLKLGKESQGKSIRNKVNVNSVDWSDFMLVLVWYRALFIDLTNLDNCFDYKRYYFCLYSLEFILKIVYSVEEKCNFFFFFFFFFFFVSTWGIWKSPGWGLNLSHCHGNATSLIHCTIAETLQKCNFYL